MQTVDVVLGVINKSTVKKLNLIRRGPKGYGLLLILRLLLYSVLKEIFSTRELVKHLKKRRRVWKKLGFNKIPCRRSMDDWFQKYDCVLDKLIKITGDKYLQLNESEWTLLDSTPIPDKNDPDARKGYTSKGPFYGFKIHASCDEYCVPLRATFTTGNIHDSKKALLILAPTPKVGGDSAYDFEELKITVVGQGSKGYFVHNPRREGKEAKKPTPKILSIFRVCVEQCNSILKEQVLKKTWTTIKGFHKKATRCLLAVLALQALAIYNLRKWGYPSVRIGDLRA
ncbi:MAG: transposase [Candidatus Omnitrophota bacterium]